MKDIDYEKSKIDFVHQIAEQSASEQYQFMNLLVERLKLLEQIYQQQPSLGHQIAKLKMGCSKVIPRLLEKEASEIAETKQVMVDAMKQVQLLF